MLSDYSLKDCFVQSTESLKKELSNFLQLKKLNVQLIHSDNCGIGKSWYISNIKTKNSRIRTVTFFRSTPLEQIIFDLNSSSIMDIHLDITIPLCGNLTTNTDSVIFHLLIFGFIKDSIGNFYLIPKSTNFFIEISGAYNTKIQSILPFCNLLPNIIINSENNPFQWEKYGDYLLKLNNIMKMNLSSPQKIFFKMFDCNNIPNDYIDINRILKYLIYLFSNEQYIPYIIQFLKKFFFKEMNEKKIISWDKIANIPIFIYNKNGELVIISKQEFCIGKIKNYSLKGKSTKELLEILKEIFPKCDDNIYNSNFSLTENNLIKLCLLKLFIDSDIPVIMMGETGIGKTFTIKYLGSLLKYNIKTIDLHGGILEEDILGIMNSILINIKKNEKFLIFFDEINTTQSMDLLKEMICDRRYKGTPLPKNIRILAACNPYRKLEINMNIKNLALTPKSMKYQTNLSQLTYNVFPISVKYY